VDTTNDAYPVLLRVGDNSYAQKNSYTSTDPFHGDRIWFLLDISSSGKIYKYFVENETFIALFYNRRNLA